MKDLFAMAGIILTITLALLFGSSLVAAQADAKPRKHRQCVTYVRTIDGNVQCIRFGR